MARSSAARNMTVGSPAGHLFAFALPLLAGSFLQQFYNIGNRTGVVQGGFSEPSVVGDTVFL